jgi:hypothetical protein
MMQSDKNENQQQQKVYLKIQAKTWGRDSHGLFDFESTNNIKQNILLLNSACKLIRRRNDVKHIPADVQLELEDRELCEVVEDYSKFFK